MDTSFTNVRHLYSRGYSIEEISEMLDMSPSSVESCVYDGRMFYEEPERDSYDASGMADELSIWADNYDREDG